VICGVEKGESMEGRDVFFFLAKKNVWAAGKGN